MIATLHTISALLNIVVFSIIGVLEFMRYKNNRQKMRLLFIFVSVYWVVVYSYFFWGNPDYYNTAEFSATWVRTGLNFTGSIMAIISAIQLKKGR